MRPISTRANRWPRTHRRPPKRAAPVVTESRRHPPTSPRELGARVVVGVDEADAPLARSLRPHRLHQPHAPEHLPPRPADDRWLDRLGRRSRAAPMSELSLPGSMSRWSPRSDARDSSEESIVIPCTAMHRMDASHRMRLERIESCRPSQVWEDGLARPSDMRRWRDLRLGRSSSTHHHRGV